MAEQTKPAPAGKDGTGDRVESLSVRKDGSLDQHNPQLINEATALAATREQFAQQAVAAVDEAEHRKRVDAERDAESKQDPTISARQRAQEAAVKSAEAKAEQVVKALS